MTRLISLFAVFGCLSLAGLTGCSSSQPAKPIDYFTIKVGTPIDEISGLLGKGELQEHDSLKVSKKPRESYPKLPAEVEWHVWTGPGKPLLVLGVVNGKIIYKRVERHNGVDGQWAVEVAGEYIEHPK